MRWKLRALQGLMAFSCSLTLANVASAQAQKGFTLDRFDPSERGSEWFVLDSLDLRGHLRPAVGVVGTWAYNPLVVYDRNDNYVTSLVEHQVFVHPGASLVLWNRARAAISLPAAIYQTGDGAAVGTKTFSAPTTAVGDLRLAGDVRLFGQHGGPVTGALGLAVFLPTGSRDDYTSDGSVRVLPRATVAGDISLFTYSARLGFHYRSLDESFDQNPLGSEVTIAAAAGVRVADKKLVIGPELYGSSMVDSFLERRSTPLEWLMGAHYTHHDFRFGAGVGTGLTRGWGTPSIRAFLSAEWAPGLIEDADNDGVPDAKDACPQTPGIRSADPARNGCPKVEPPKPIADADQDGIADAVDACPKVAGVPNADPKKNGCPSDRDGDDVYDVVDACPDQPGRKDADPKKNGCPIVDRDKDGVPDEKDACPELAGPPSNDPTTNGCPSDRDGDGAYDVEDACPDAAGPPDPDPTKNGCPLARIEGGEIKITEQVRFKTDSAEILRDSDPILLAIATTLKDHPEITKVRVEGHTDNTGPAKSNERLSQWRAEAVVKWLTSHGLVKDRFVAVGVGVARPIDTNATKEGRQNNRRVEFHIEGSQPAAPKP